jgi:hypothetical protein
MPSSPRSMPISATGRAKAVFQQARFNLIDLFRPPFGKTFDFLLNFMLR